MFHNISDIQDNNVDEIHDNKLEVLFFLRNIFNLKNILIYIISFYVSMLSIKGRIYPFALSTLGACVCTQTPIIGVLVATSIGLIYVTDISVFIRYIITVVLFLAFNIIIKPKKSRNDRNEMYKLTYRLMTFNFFVQFIGAGIAGFSNRLLYAFLHSAFVYIGYKICVCGIATIKNINRKDIFSNIELISMGLLISIMLFMLNNLMLFNINIANLLMIFLIFYISFKNGYICGGLSGLVIGLFGILYSKCDILYLLNITLTGVCGGLFSEFNKFASLTAIVISNLIISAAIQSNPVYFINLAGIIILYTLSIFVKDNIKIDVEDLVNNIPLLEEKLETSLAEKKALDVNIPIIDETQQEREEYIVRQSKFVDKFYTAFNKKTTNLLYDELIKNKDIIENAYEKIDGGETIDKDSFVKILEDKNYYIMSEDKSMKTSINEIIRIINRIYNQSKKEKN